MPLSPPRSPAAPPTCLPEFPPGDVTAGLDWATADHAVAIVNGRGTITEQFLVDATGAGLRELVRRLRRAGVAEIAIERGDGQVVDALLEAGLSVVVISPNQVHNLRGRYGSAGNKDDRFDAFVPADTLRTDRARLRPLIPDTAATVQLRSAVRARKDLLTHRVGLANQLRAHLRFFHPGPVGLFADLDAVTSLRFLGRFTCQDDTDWLTPSRLATWLRSVGYTGRKDPAALHAHLTAPEGAGPRGPVLCTRPGGPRVDQVITWVAPRVGATDPCSGFRRHRPRRGRRGLHVVCSDAPTPRNCATPAPDVTASRWLLVQAGDLVAAAVSDGSAVHGVHAPAGAAVEFRPFLESSPAAAFSG